MPRAKCFLVLGIVLVVFSSQLAAQSVTTVFEPVADTYLRRGTPNVSHGGSPVLEVKSSPINNRVLVRFDLAEVAATLGQGTLVSAELELFVETNGGGWGTSGRAVDLHRVNMPWTEAGATWYCADDPMPLNNSPDCSPGWGGGSVEPAVVATALHTNDLLGPVRFDLTQELAALLAAGEHHGWAIERGAGVTSGTVYYARAKVRRGGRRSWWWFMSRRATSSHPCSP
ncbi:MAG: DNRLRE domain-containing protein [Thermoanaerobaculia bacterium]|nr:DNRLRE domain-containing protein [Thermoanaerobaculia bacterium]